MTNLENLKKLADGLGADASKCSTNLGALNVISAALGGAGDAETNAEAIEDIAQAAPAAMEQNVVWGAEVISPKASVVSVTVPEGVTSTSDGAFNGFSALESVTFPHSLKDIGTGCFNNVATLTTVNIPDGVTVIRESVFAGCSSLKTIDIPDSVTAFKSSAFAVCGFEEFEIPENVTEVGAGCFGGCTKLSKMVIKSPTIAITDGALGGCGAEVGGITIEIHAPENSISGAPWGATNATVNWLG